MSDLAFHGSAQGAGVSNDRRAPLVRSMLALPALNPLFRLIASAKAMDRLAAALFALVVILVAAYATLRPDYNWDMVAYVGTALEDRYDDPVELHRQTWARIDAGASERQLYHLKFSNPYNVHQWKNPW